ncbi:MAG: TIGR02281 family clan AA aspartic protease [Allosphingosinicella sp.]|uniref:retropepsin-like aspartic protease family protein n=1 Tax=Allosphingosinicella sp. TaxID=2823234 RepID=UPI0039276294
MGKALLLVVLVGLGLGFLIPLDEGDSPKAEVAQSAEPAEVAAERPAGPAAAGWGTETRLRRESGGHFLAQARINGQPIQAVVDTGASTVALTVADAQRAGIAVDPSRFDVVGTGASGAVRGHEISLSSVSVDGKEVRSIRGVVLEGLDVSLLGQSYLSRISGVEMRGDEMVLR